jgi:predicted permease
MFTALKVLSARLRALVKARDLDLDFEQELASHLAMLEEDNIRRGMPPDQARRAAVIRIGGVASTTERHRDVRGIPALEAVLQDLRFAFRLLVRERWVSAAAIAVLALGIGVNATGFTVVNAAFIRGLPYEDSDRLFVLTWQSRQGRRVPVSYAELQDWRARSGSFASLAAYRAGTMNISDDRGLPERMRGAWLTADALAVIGEQPLVGRGFALGGDRAASEPVVLIGYNVWKNRYGAAPDVIGQSLRLNGQPATIVGVMPDRMRFPENTEIWAPLAPAGAGEPRTARALTVFGRLRDGVDRDEARAELDGIAGQLATAYRDDYENLVGVRVETFTERFVGGVARTMFLAMMGAVGFVLLIACANVANLLLSRSTDRGREIAVRVALGATRWRVVRQLLIESLVLSFIGGGIGVLLAVGAMRVFDAAVQDPGKPFWIIFSVDYVVLAYVAGISVLTAILFGLAPALHVSKSRAHDVMKDGGRGSAGSRRARALSGTLVVAELALTVVLLVGAGLMIRSFMKLYTLDVGFKIRDLMTMRMSLPDSKYATANARRAFYEQLESRLGRIAGVEAVATTTSVPPLDAGNRLVEIDGRPGPSPEQTFEDVATVTISPGFFEVLRLPITRGRGFREVDGAPGSEAVIINERMASQFFPGEDPLGKRLRLIERAPAPGSPGAVWRTIVGVSPSIRHSSPRELDPNAVVYVPSRQDPPAETSLVVRSQLPPAAVMDAVRREVQAIDRDQPVFTIQTLEQMLAEVRWPFRVFGGMFTLFGAIALVLSVVGLSGVMAYSVAQRRQEIGVRIALGAEARHVSWLILRRGLFQLAIGLAIGLAGALALSGILNRALVDITPADPITFAAITLFLSLVSIAACLLPARQATRVDPVVALRTD